MMEGQILAPGGVTITPEMRKRMVQFGESLLHEAFSAAANGKAPGGGVGWAAAVFLGFALVAVCGLFLNFKLDVLAQQSVESNAATARALDDVR